jgi:YVTN family beta-propeller protein
MLKKQIKRVLLVVVPLYALFVLVVLLVRMPSYTLQTSGKLYIVNKLSRDIQVFDLYTGEEIAEIPIDMQAHEVIAMYDDNDLILTDYGDRSSKGNTIKIIDTKTNTLEKTITVKGSMNANGLVYVAEPNKIGLVDYVTNNVSILNIATGSIEKRIPTEQKKSHLAVLHPKEPLGYVTNMQSNSVSVIDLQTEKVVTIVPCGLTTESIDITPDGSEVWVTNKNGNSITIIDTRTNTVLDTLPTGNEPLKIKFSIDGKYALVANANDGSVSVYDRYAKEKVKNINIPGKHTLVERVLYHTPRPVNILMHPNGNYAFIANSNASKIEVIDMARFEIVSTIGTGSIPDAMAFVP